MRLLRSKQISPDPPYSFQDRFRNIARIAIIYPETEKWLRIARYSLQRMYNQPEKFDYLLLVPDPAREKSLDVQHQYQAFDHHPGEEARLRLRERIIGFRPDILLQLEPNPGEKLIRLISQLDVALKIGFGDERSDLNVIYSQSESGFYEKNILNLIALLERK